MTRESVDTKAKRYLCEGRVTVYQANERVIKARVRGNGEEYRVVVTAGGFACPCPAQHGRCAHILAMQLICLKPTTHPKEQTQ